MINSVIITVNKAVAVCLKTQHCYAVRTIRDLLNTTATWPTSPFKHNLKKKKKIT